MAIRLYRRTEVQHTVDHATTYNRDLNDQHPINSITGLEDYLDNIRSEMASINDTMSDRIVVGGNENVVMEILQHEWQYDSENERYHALADHMLETEDIIIDFYDSQKKSQCYQFRIINSNRVEVYIDEPEDIKFIINASLGHLSENLRTIKTSDFMNDEAILSNRTWSSMKISSMLNSYARRNDVYTRQQSDMLFASKALEHDHENMETLSRFDVDSDGNLLYNDRIIAVNVKPYLKEIKWTSELRTKMSLLLDTATLYEEIGYTYITSNEFIIRNSDPVDNLELLIEDDEIEILRVTLGPREAQKYHLGKSPKIKIYVMGKFDGKFYMEALGDLGNYNLYRDFIDDYGVLDGHTWSSKKIKEAIEEAVSEVDSGSISQGFDQSIDDLYQLGYENRNRINANADELNNQKEFDFMLSQRIDDVNIKDSQQDDELGVLSQRASSLEDKSHSHTNKVVINSLEESGDGTLMYKGEPVYKKSEYDTGVYVGQSSLIVDNGSKDNPFVTEIPIIYTSNFNKLPIEVLQLQGNKPSTKISNRFDNGESLQYGERVFYDNGVSLKTSYQVVGDEISDRIYEFDISYFQSGSNFKTITNIR